MKIPPPPRRVLSREEYTRQQARKGRPADYESYLNGVAQVEKRLKRSFS